MRALAAVKGRVVFILVVMLLLQLTYPLSLVSSLYNSIYFVVYLGLLASGIHVTGTTRTRLSIAIGVSAVTLAAGIPWVLTSGDNLWLTLITFLGLVSFQVLIVAVLLEYIFYEQEVNRSVVYAALTIYILLGNIFSAIYNIIQIFDDKAFASSIFDTPLIWQHVVYFSYATLTSLGYGDITPRSAWAQSVVAIEAMIGLLYIAIIIGRLVSVYSTDALQAEVAASKLSPKADTSDANTLSANTSDVNTPN
ncbi:MAG: potassium channel family protein [Deinococcota bacterium]